MLSSKLFESMSANFSRPAIHIYGRFYTYGELHRLALGLIRLIQTTTPTPTPPVIAVLAEHSLPAYITVLASALAGWTFVPLNPSYPLKRLRRIVEMSNAQHMVVDGIRAKTAATLLRNAPWPMTVVQFDRPLEHNPIKNTHQILTDLEIPIAVQEDLQKSVVLEDHPLYVMFTSGTTGEPKGIVIPSSNVHRYLESISMLFDFKQDDRFSQFFKLSFDLSVHDIFVCWTAGGCLYVPTNLDLLDPISYTQQHNLTVWFSVPSLAALAMRFGKLSHNSLSNLRHGLFCGEALSWEVVKGFKTAAPNATVTNLYGPTETTIAITKFDLPGSDTTRSSLEVVPIGQPFPGQETLILDENLQPVPQGQTGELFLGGNQLAHGYLANKAQTKEKFLHKEVKGRQCTRWYRTGDCVKEDPAAGLMFLGRKDQQIKLRGYRVEITEVEAALQQAAENPFAIIVAWPINTLGVADTLTGFICTPHAPIPVVMERLQKLLPDYMLPHKIISIQNVSFNNNHKLDRQAITKSYEALTCQEGIGI